MPVAMNAPIFVSEQFDFLPWSSAAALELPTLLEEEEESDADCLSFDHITTVLSRCVTPPLESLPPSPMDSGSSSPLDSGRNSPSASRCPSPFNASELFMDILLQYETSSGQSSSCQSSGQASMASSPCPSPPASPMNYSSFDAHAPNAVAALKQARRANKLQQPLKVRKLAAAGVLADAPALAHFAASCSSSVSSASSASASKLVSKRSKAVALATKRDFHNISERNRRQELKLSFTMLQNLVPNLISASRAHTGTVLKETIAYIHALQQEEDHLLAAKAAMLREQSLLLAAGASL